MSPTKTPAKSKAQVRLERTSPNTPTNEVAAEPETFIVQHVAPGYHCVTDLGLTFGPFEVKNLTDFDSSLLKRSRDMTLSIINGNLIKISQEEADQILIEEAAAIRAQVMRSSRQRATRQIRAGDKMLDAEMINLSQADANHLSDDVIAASGGGANDTVAYAIAYSQAREVAIDMGMAPPTPREFAVRVAKDQGLVQKYITRQAGVVSGDPHRARATVLTAPRSIDQGMGVTQMPMSNYAADQILAGSNEYGVSSYYHEIDELPLAEEIDLLEEEAGEDTGGGIRRM